MCDIYLQQYKNSSLDDRDLISFNDLLGKLKLSYYYLHYQYQAEERCCSSRFYLTTEMLQQPAAQALHIGLILNTIKCYYMDIGHFFLDSLYIVYMHMYQNIPRCKARNCCMNDLVAIASHPKVQCIFEYDCRMRHKQVT